MSGVASGAAFVGERHHLQCVALEPFGIRSVVTGCCQNSMREFQSGVFDLRGIFSIVVMRDFLPCRVEGSEYSRERFRIDSAFNEATCLHSPSSASVQLGQGACRVSM